MRTFLKPISRQGIDVRATSVGQCADWETLAGLRCSIDPRLLLRTGHGPAGLALEAALIAAATAGRTELPAGPLAKLAGLKVSELAAALERLNRESALSACGRDVRPVQAALDGKVVHIGKVQRQVLVQDLYWAFPVAALAAAPSAPHARAYLLAGLASVRRVGECDMPVTDVRRWLRLPARVDVVAEITKLTPWLRGQFPDHNVGASAGAFPDTIRIAAARVDGNRYVADLAFDPSTYQLPYLGYRAALYGAPDGVVRGHSMALDRVLSAKVQCWVAEAFGLDTPPSQWRWIWLAVVGAWEAGEPTYLNWWPTERIGELLADGWTITEIFCDFVMTASHESVSAEEQYARPHGLLVAISPGAGRKLDRQRKDRAGAANGVPVKARQYEVVQVMPSDGAPRQRHSPMPFIPFAEVQQHLPAAAALLGESETMIEAASAIAIAVARADAGVFARCARGKRQPEDVIRAVAEALIVAKSRPRDFAEVDRVRRTAALVSAAWRAAKDARNP